MSREGKNILIISPSWLGDIIMSQSLMKIIKQDNAENRITVSAPAYAHPILQRMAEADVIIKNPFAHGEFAPAERFKEGMHFKQMHFDEAYILPNSFKSALSTFFAGIPVRRGWKGESRYGLINYMQKDKNAFPLMVERYVSLFFAKDGKTFSAADLPKIPYPSLRTEKLTESLTDRLGLNKDRAMLILGCGANYGPAKMWPVEYFAAVSSHFIAQGFSVTALGTEKDKSITDGVYAALTAEEQKYFCNAAGKTGLTEALDLCKAASLAVCNDSGLMHTAAAADIPQVCIYGSTTPNYTPPLSDKALCAVSDEPCSPCFKRTCSLGTYQCLKGLTAERVIVEAEKLLKLYPPHPLI